jgi:hypothetical protein
MFQNMTLAEAFSIIARRRREAFRQTGYIPPEEARFIEEVNAIHTHETFTAFVQAGQEFLERLPPKEAIAGIATVVLRFGIDVGKLLQSANAGKPQSVSGSPEERQNTKEN